MNERIKELIVESGNGQMRDGRLYPHIGIRFEEDWQRFAELIVRECAQLAMTQHCSTSPADYGDMEPYEQGCDDTASAISGLIRRTFGVE